MLDIYKRGISAKLKVIFGNWKNHVFYLVVWLCTMQGLPTFLKGRYDNFFCPISVVTVVEKVMKLFDSIIPGPGISGNLKLQKGMEKVIEN